MWIENKSTENLESQNTWWPKSSSLEAQQNVVNTQEKVHKLVKINTFLESIDDTKEDQYEKTLLKLDKDSLNILLNKPQAEILQLLQKTDSELQAHLIQAQIDELDKKGEENLSDKEIDKYISLQEQLIATKDSTISVENNKQAQENQKQSEIEKTNIKIADLRGVLLSNSKLADNSKIKDIRDKFDEIEKDEDQALRQTLLDEIINSLKTAWTLESIAKDLGWVESEAYATFKEKMLVAEPSLQDSFDRVELKMVWNLAKAKLWTSDLNGVDLGSNVLSKTEDGVRTSYSKDEGRYLSSTGEWKYKIESEINPKYEEEITEINSATKEELVPINESLGLVSKILEYLKNARQNGEDFEEVKKSIQEQNPEFYDSEWLDNITSFNEMMMILKARKYELDEEKEEIKSEAIERMDELLRQNQEEIDEKEKHKKEMLKFFSATGFDRLSQTETDKLIELVNINPWSYGLDWPIDLENGDLGFNKDFGDKRISPNEKLAFVKFFNKMLWEDVVRVDEKLQTIIPLDSNDENKLQKLSNKKVGFFMGTDTILWWCRGGGGRRWLAPLKNTRGLIL